MEEEDVERILNSIERVYGKDVMEIGATNARFRQLAIRGFLYGNKDAIDKKKSEAAQQHARLIGPYRITYTEKQYEPLSEGWTEKYGED